MYSSPGSVDRRYVRALTSLPFLIRCGPGSLAVVDTATDIIQLLKPAT